MARPSESDYASFYNGYIGLVPESEILPAIRSQLEELLGFLQTISEPESLVRHAPYTWSTREVVGHLIDAERVFSYRALRFSRGDRTPLPGFDETAYMAAAGFDRIDLAKLADEFMVLRRSTVHLLENLDVEAWERGGEANGASITVRALAYVIVGHVRRHGGILRKRFGRT